MSANAYMFQENDINFTFGGFSKHFNSDGPRNDNNHFIGVDYVFKRTDTTIHSFALIHSNNSFWENTNFYGYGWRKFEKISKDHMFSYGCTFGTVHGYKEVPRIAQQNNGFAPALLPNIRYTYKIMSAQVSMLGPDAVAFHFLVLLN